MGPWAGPPCTRSAAMPAPHTWAALATTALCTLRTQVSARGLHHKGVRGGGMRGNTLPPLAAVRRFYTQPALTAPSSGWGVAVCGEYPVHLRVCCWPCCTCLLITGSHGMMYTPASCSIYIKHLPDQVCTALQRSCIARSHTCATVCMSAVGLPSRDCWLL